MYTWKEEFLIEVLNEVRKIRKMRLIVLYVLCQIDSWTYQVKVVPRSVSKKLMKLHALPRHDSRPDAVQI